MLAQEKTGQINMKLSDFDRFCNKIILDPEKGCWLWDAALDGRGYGKFYLDRKYAIAHRLSYILFRGEIGDGLEMDHLCRVRRCVNPWHLEEVTHQENVIRGDAPGAVQRRHQARTHCKNGHPFDAVSSNPKGKYRICRTCRRASFLKYNAANPGRNNKYYRPKVVG